MLRYIQRMNQFAKSNLVWTALEQNPQGRYKRTLFQGSALGRGAETIQIICKITHDALSEETEQEERQQVTQMRCLATELVLELIRA